MKHAVRRKVLLLFVQKYPGTRHKAFPFGHGYHFDTPDTPDLRRAPFRMTTLDQLIAEGYVTKKGPVVLTEKGTDYLDPNNVYPIDKRGRRKRLAKDWC